MYSTDVQNLSSQQIHKGLIRSERVALHKIGPNILLHFVSHGVRGIDPLEIRCTSARFAKPNDNHGRERKSDFHMLKLLLTGASAEATPKWLHVCLGPKAFSLLRDCDVRVLYVL